MDGHGQSAVKEEPELIPEGQHRTGILGRWGDEIPGQIALGDDRLPARTVGQSQDLRVAREIVVEFQWIHPAFDFNCNSIYFNTFI